MSAKVSNFRCEFVEFVPEQIGDGVVYVSITYATAIHRCACGCGQEVVTPISPTDWRLIFDGKSISLDPSIGNWSFDCRSHYFIRNNRVLWCDEWSQNRIDRVRAYDVERKQEYYGIAPLETDKNKISTESAKPQPSRTMKILQKIHRFWPF